MSASDQADLPPDPKLGESGYLFDHGKYFPARVICDDLVQTFGPVDQIVAYQPHLPNLHEFTIRLTQGCDPCSGCYWVSAAQFEEIERAKIAKERAVLLQREARLSVDFAR